MSVGSGSVFGSTVVVGGDVAVVCGAGIVLVGIGGFTGAVVEFNAAVPLGRVGVGLAVELPGSDSGRLGSCPGKVSLGIAIPSCEAHTKTKPAQAVSVSRQYTVRYKLPHHQGFVEVC